MFKAKKLTTVKDLTRDLEIRPLDDQNAAATAHLIALSYVQRSHGLDSFGFDYQTQRMQADVHVQKTIQEQMGIVVYDCKENKYVGACLCEDVFSLTEFTCKVPTSGQNARVFERWDQFNDFIYSYSSELYSASHFGEKIDILDLTVLEEYGNLGIGLAMLNFAIHEHPLTRQAKCVISETFSESAKCICKKLGFKFLARYAFDIDAQTNEHRFLRSVDENLGGLKSDNSVCDMLVLQK